MHTNTTRNGTNNLSNITDLLPDSLNFIINKRSHSPSTALDSTDANNEILEYMAALLLTGSYLGSMSNFRMELDAIYPFFWPFHCGKRCSRSGGNSREAGRKFRDLIAVAHPHGDFRIKTLEQQRRVVELEGCFPKLLLFATNDFSASGMGNFLK